MDESAPKPVPSGRNIGRYVLFDEIAVGGMATVHLGRLVGPVGFARTVAIKRLHAQFAKDPDFGAMFLDEAHLAARIRHPNVVPTIDVVQTDDELFIVMEYVQGESLSRLGRKATAKGERLPLPIVASIMSGTLHGLHAAHEAKHESGEPLHIVHRDLSPQNILVGVDGTARILDFGVAKAAQRMQTTREGQLKGKVAYMSPEQLTSDEVDRRSDIFAAGVVLWEALTGKRLFDAPSEIRVLTKIMNGEIQAPSTVTPGIPAEFDAICMRALAREPKDRFATAREMALAIEQASPLAPPSTVGTWVETLAHDALANRAARIAEVESRSDVFPRGRVSISDDVPVEHEEPKTDVSSAVVVVAPKHSTAKVGALLAGVVVLLCVGILFATRSPTPPSAATATATATATPTATVSATATPAAVTASAAPSVAPPPNVVPATTRATPPATAKPAPTAHPADRCSPPFTIDSSGIKHVKPECL